MINFENSSNIVWNELLAKVLRFIDRDSKLDIPYICEDMNRAKITNNLKISRIKTTNI